MIFATTLATLTLATGSVHVAVAPQNVARNGIVRISVQGLPATAVAAKFEGGVAGGGRWLNWVPLLPDGDGAWHSILRAPGYLGVFPVQLRAGGKVIDSGVTIRILPAGFAGRPAFWNPKAVAVWWAGTVHAHVLTAGTWRSGFFTHRVDTLNRLLRVVYERSDGRHSVRYLSIARLGLNSPWRLLETARAP